MPSGRGVAEGATNGGEEARECTASEPRSKKVMGIVNNWLLPLDQEKDISHWVPCAVPPGETLLYCKRCGWSIMADAVYYNDEYISFQGQ